ncbi:MAG: SCP2 sterol-binding domain-containing protein [Actinobacteria bacterium]|jgi:hypothetical protein|nr:SCP2 sterol-binding domain-containing protein [Actinomycetota bacterium]
MTADSPAPAPAEPLRFLDPAWVGAFNEALHGVSHQVPAGTSLVAADGKCSVCYVLPEAPPAALRVLLRFDVGSLTMLIEGGRGDDEQGDDERGRERRADVTVRLDRPSALALLAGELAPAAALAGGQIRVRGDLAVLLAMHSVIDEARPLLAELLSRTVP